MPRRGKKICVLLRVLHQRPHAKFPHGRSPHAIEITRRADYLQDLLTIVTDETCISPCSSFVFFIPVAAASSLACSFALCIVTFETVPVAVMVCPTWSARTTESLFTSHVLPSFPIRTNLSGPDPCVCRQPVIVLSLDFDLPLLVVSCPRDTLARSITPSASNITKFFIALL